MCGQRRTGFTLDSAQVAPGIPDEDVILPRKAERLRCIRANCHFQCDRLIGADGELALYGLDFKHAQSAVVDQAVIVIINLVGPQRSVVDEAAVDRQVANTELAVIYDRNALRNDKGDRVVVEDVAGSDHSFRNGQVFANRDIAVGEVIFHSSVTDQRAGFLDAHVRNADDAMVFNG